MEKPRYRILVRKDQTTCDVELTIGTDPARIVETFNSEAEAWSWVNEQKAVNRFARQQEERGRSRRPDRRDGN